MSVFKARISCPEDVGAKQLTRPDDGVNPRNIMRTLADNQLGADALARRNARRIERERLHAVAYAQSMRPAFVSKHTAKKDKLHVRFVREHPRVKVLTMPDHAYRAAGLR